MFISKLLDNNKQSGAEEACWAHKLEVGRSKLPFAKYDVLVLESIFLKPNYFKNFFITKLLNDKKQSGNVEVCWAHNPKVGRSKLQSAKYQVLIFKFNF